MYIHAGKVAERLGISERNAQRLMREGRIASFRVGPGEKLLRTTEEAIDDYVRGQYERYRRPVTDSANPEIGRFLRDLAA